MSRWRHFSSCAVAARPIAMLALVVGGLFAVARPARSAELSERVARWARELDFAGSLELRRGTQTLAHVDRLAGGAAPGPAAAEHVFWIGSVSKQFAAAAVLRLAERQQLSLSRAPGDYLPQLPPSALSKDGVRCSIEHLLSHSCGLPRGLSWDFLRTARHLSEPARAQRFYEQLGREPLLFAPGTAYSYSNAGYMLLGLLIQHVSGQSYEAFLQSELWGPLGMRATGIAPRPGVAPVRGQIRLGPVWLDAGRWMLLDPWTPSTVGAGGSVYSTLGDLQLWNAALHHGRVLAPESYRAMITPRHGNYGLGLVITQAPFGTLISHGGSHSPHSVSAILAYVPEHDLSLAGGASRSYEDSGLKALGEALLASAAGSPDVAAPSVPGWGATLLSSLSATLQLAVVGYALYTSWLCFVRRWQLDRLRWWLRYHTALLAVLAYALRWRDRPFDPLIVAWGAWCLGVAWASRWWTLPAWNRGSGVKKPAKLFAQLTSLAVVTYFSCRCVISERHWPWCWSSSCPSRRSGCEDRALPPPVAGSSRAPSEPLARFDAAQWQ